MSTTVKVTRMSGRIDTYLDSTFATDGDGYTHVRSADGGSASYAPGQVSFVVGYPDKPAEPDWRDEVVARVDRLLADWGRIDGDALLPARSVWQQLQIARRRSNDRPTDGEATR